MQNQTRIICRLASALALSVLLLSPTAAAIRAAEAPLKYLAAGQLDASLVLCPPPLPGSAEQAADLAAVVSIRSTCSSNEAALAFSEKKFSAFNFTPAIGAFFQSNNLPQTTAFLSRVQAEAEILTGLAKGYWKRPRPYTVDPGLASGKLEKSFGYPSGHSAEGMVLALVLADLFPGNRDAILAIGRELGWHRVWIARHYPTDIYAGRVFAQAIVRELKNSPAFQQELEPVKNEIEAASKSASSTAASGPSNGRIPP